VPVRRVLAYAGLSVAIGAIGLATAQSGGAPYTVERHALGAGGGRASGGAFVVDGIVGQADVDPLQPASGGAYALTGGFAPAEAMIVDSIFAGGFESD
jgi:hypothetical protein